MVVCVNQEEAYYDETLVSTCCSNSLFLIIIKLCQKCTSCLDLKLSSRAARTEIHRQSEGHAIALTFVFSLYYLDCPILIVQ